MYITIKSLILYTYNVWYSSHNFTNYNYFRSHVWWFRSPWQPRQATLERNQPTYFLEALGLIGSKPNPHSPPRPQNIAKPTFQYPVLDDGYAEFLIQLKLGPSLRSPILALSIVWMQFTHWCLYVAYQIFIDFFERLWT